MSGLRVSGRAQRVREMQGELGVLLDRFQRERGLTSIEMLQAVNAWQGTCLKFMLRAERHPGNPGLPADEDGGRG